MNKQLINKYKPEFDHWLNEGSILARVITSDEDDFMYTIWYVVDSNDLEKWKAEYLFNLTNTQIEFYQPQFIINDEYVEFRKALAEGKTIEYLGQSSNLWQELKDANFNLHQTCYRIKPDEPKFKVGDFVRYIHAHTPKALEINNINGDRYYFTNSEMSCIEHELITWTPVKGEWCWFYNNKDSKCSHLAQFYDMNKSFDNSLSTFMSSPITKWHYCKPFLNSLPSHLKDK